MAFKLNIKIVKRLCYANKRVPFYLRQSECSELAEVKFSHVWLRDCLSVLCTP